VVAGTGSSRRRELGGEDKVELWVACELRGISGELLGVEVEAEGALMELSMMTWCQWRMVAWRGGDSATRNGEELAKPVSQPQGLVGEEEEVGGLTRGGDDTVHQDGE
jgi:hypothetical protein